REDEEVDAKRRFDGEIEAAACGRGERLWKLDLGDGRHREDGPGDFRIKDQLARYARRFRKDGAQTLMPLDQIGECRFEGSLVEGPANAEREREIIARALSFEMVEEPEPTLREGERDYLRTRPWPQRRPRRRLGLVEPFSEPGDGGDFEQRTKWQLDIESGTDFRDQMRHEQRVTAEVEEVVMDAHALKPERLGPEAGKHFLRRRPRWRVFGAG